MSRTNHDKRYKNRQQTAPFCCNKRRRSDCPWCKGNRLHSYDREKQKADEQVKEIFGSVA